MLLRNLAARHAQARKTAPAAAAPPTSTAKMASRSAPVPFGSAPPPMPPFVQAAFAAARHDVTTAARASGKAPPPAALQLGAVPPPPQPPMVKLAIQAAKDARASALKAQHTGSSKLSIGAAPTGLLTSLEQEAELLRSMHMATATSHCAPRAPSLPYAISDGSISHASLVCPWCFACLRWRRAAAWERASLPGCAPAATTRCQQTGSRCSRLSICHRERSDGDGVGRVDVGARSAAAGCAQDCRRSRRPLRQVAEVFTGLASARAGEEPEACGGRNEGRQHLEEGRPPPRPRRHKCQLSPARPGEVSADRGRAALSSSCARVPQHVTSSAARE